MITVITKGNRNNLYGRKIRVIIDQLPYICTNIEDALRAFKNDVMEIKKANWASAHDHYKAGEIINNSFEIWHHKVNGDRERLVATVIET